MISNTSPFMFGQVGELQRILNEAFEDEMDFNLQGADKLRLGWMPFQMADFIGIMSEVIRECDGPRYFEVGAGIGTKMMVAKYLFGLEVAGIEYSETLATVANQKKRGHVITGDALTTGYTYNDCDILWMYRPFRDPVLERQLEERIYAEMRPGAIFAGGHLEHTPPGWLTVVDDIDVGNRGAWKKP